mmetsp:Transcript_2582/g.3917  ORF Transcript_2582/g.3917 Transcript_2582/m.3917 type:complete len:82 (+) Transcript_2582:38-283(+)
MIQNVRFLQKSLMGYRSRVVISRNMCRPSDGNRPTQKNAVVAVTLLAMVCGIYVMSIRQMAGVSDIGELAEIENLESKKKE